MKLVLRALAIGLAVVAQGFALQVGNSASTSLGIAYVASFVLLMVAAFKIWTSTVADE